jgi:hypothetical protein
VSLDRVVGAILLGVLTHDAPADDRTGPSGQNSRRVLNAMRNLVVVNDPGVVVLAGRRRSRRARRTT